MKSSSCCLPCQPEGSRRARLPSACHQRLQSRIPGAMNNNCASGMLSLDCRGALRSWCARQRITSEMQIESMARHVVPARRLSQLRNPPFEATFKPSDLALIFASVKCLSTLPLPSTKRCRKTSFPVLRSQQTRSVTLSHESSSPRHCRGPSAAEIPPPPRRAPSRRPAGATCELALPGPPFSLSASDGSTQLLKHNHSEFMRQDCSSPECRTTRGTGPSGPRPCALRSHAAAASAAGRLGFAAVSPGSIGGPHPATRSAVGKQKQRVVDTRDLISSISSIGESFQVLS